VPSYKPYSLHPTTRLIDSESYRLATDVNGQRDISHPTLGCSCKSCHNVSLASVLYITSSDVFSSLVCWSSDHSHVSATRLRDKNQFLDSRIQEYSLDFAGDQDTTSFLTLFH